MARITKPLTATEIKAAKPREKSYTMFDGGGLYLEVTISGSKRWRLKYSFNEKEKRVSLGIYPHVSLEDARKKKNAIKSKIANDIDPFEKKVIPKVVLIEKTFKEWADWYIEQISSELSDGHISRTIKGFKKDVFPVIGKMPVNDIKARDIIKIMHIMKERGAIESARKTFSSINRVFAKAISNFPDEIDRNPTADIKLGDVLGAKKTTNYPIITDPKELGALLKAIKEYSGDSSTKLALEMIAHVFVRPINIRYAKWQEIDFNTKQWVIPAEKMKTKKELIVPLSKQVIELLNNAKNDSELVFPSMRSKTSPMSDNALVGALRRMGYSRDEIVAHSFRGIFSTIAHEKGIYAHDAIETQLAHTVGSNVSQAYNRAKYLDDRTEMMQWWSDYLTSITK